MKAHRDEFNLTSMCRVLKVHRSGYYAWLSQPQSRRAIANAALTQKIQASYEQSMGIYGSPRIFCDLREAGVACGENRVARLMQLAQIRSTRGYKRPRFKVGKPAVVAPNQLQRQFQSDTPDSAWVTDITYSTPSQLARQHGVKLLEHVWNAVPGDGNVLVPGYALSLM